jgi:hypothetical protein
VADFGSAWSSRTYCKRVWKRRLGRENGSEGGRARCWALFIGGGQIGEVLGRRSMANGGV